MTEEPLSLTVLVLTFNEERNLPALLQSLAPLRAPVIVVDSGSTDRTVEIAASFGATVLTHPFATHSRQWKWGLDQVPQGVEWILGLDADQQLTPEACSSIGQAVRGASCDGGYLARRQVFRGRWIRHGGYYPKYLLKLFRRGAVIIDEADLVDHHFEVRGRTLILAGDLIESNENENDIRVWTEKHLRYATLQAREELALATARGTRKARLFGNPDQRTTWLKNRWRSMPLYVRPVLFFIYRYFIRLGFLDGRQGFVFHVLQGFWYRLMVDITIEEMRDRASTPVK